jgi:hypothetical protein
MRFRYQESNGSWHYCRGKRSKGKSNESKPSLYAIQVYIAKVHVYLRKDLVRDPDSFFRGSAEERLSIPFSSLYLIVPTLGPLGLSGVPNHLYIGIIDG